MKQTFFIIRYEGKPYYIAQAEELEPSQAYELLAKCEKNVDELVKKYTEEIKALTSEVLKLKKEVAYLKGETDDVGASD